MVTEEMAAVVPPLWKRKRMKMRMLQVQVRKGSLATATNACIASTTELDNIISNSSENGSSDSNIDMNEDARMLCNVSRSKDALHVFHPMNRRGIRLHSSTYASLLQECINKNSLSDGKLIHAHMIHSGFTPQIFLYTKLIIMYAKCGSLLDARKLLDKMPRRNVVSWNAMIAAYARHEYNDEALTLYYQMQREGIKPDKFTFAGVLPACANLAALKHGYAQNGPVEEALKLFQKMPDRNVVSWTAMLAGYAQNLYVGEALRLFQKMPERNDVSWTAMIAGYAQNGYVDEALQLFQKMPERNVVSWTAMIAGNAQNGHFGEALKLFRHMQLTGTKPDSNTFTSVLPACAHLAVLRDGKSVHEDIIKNGFQSDTFVENALVDMYSKCGSIDDARQVFDKMCRRDAVSWTAMIAGYAMHGYVKEALQLFEQMQNSNTKPDHVTFIGVLSACCHSGQVDDGWQYFDCMSRDYHITPVVEHYCCMVDLLGRAGYLDEAQEFIKKIPIKPNAAVWASLLGACRIHMNIELAERVAEQLFELDPKTAAHYVLLSNIYAAYGRWDEVEKVRKLMKDRQVKKIPGCSWIEVNDKVYGFLMGDKSHPQTHQIYAKLDRLSGQMKEAGYIPNMNFLLHDVE